MAYSIGTQKHSVYQIPAWIPMYLGRHIRVVSSIDDRPFPVVGAVGILDAIQWSYDDCTIHLAVVFGDDLSNTTTVPMCCVEPF